ncbi:unnamed protein product (macronuclear) [Paramecium tetraurelia]|uniref:Uncharacterized protein n=1 Tax=Paramecium tetraurelia TaxID=5888 RepID=A0C3U3_PARTE|nr:uncharacterized protein GSPATT00034939001 [Paramecium tetraurelia]CAK65460.1 unnamed protein product [Paramecium tetraurelia]|eukprot:XP_001432857.1 hypothetical protein (macronuclear) [Paramecium tetraurelia strain d4-2]
MNMDDQNLFEGEWNGQSLEFLGTMLYSDILAQNSTNMIDIISTKCPNQKQLIESSNTIQENNREKKQVLQIKQKLEKIDYEKEINYLKGQLDDLKKIKDFKYIVLTFNKNNDEISIPLCQIEYVDIIHGWICKYIWKSIIYKSQDNLGEYRRRSFLSIQILSKMKLQLNSIFQGFPQLLETRLPTPEITNLGTPLPFYQFIGQIKEFTNLLLQ